jgi:hypothetical protein
MSGDQSITDPATLVSGLRADDIRSRLAELEGEERALRVLLRAAAARERCRPGATRTKSIDKGGTTRG